MVCQSFNQKSVYIVFAWSALRLFTSVPACDWSIWLFWFSSLWRNFTQCQSPAIESERKNISTWYNFLNSWSNHAKLSDFDHYIAVLCIWKLEQKCHFVAEKLDFEYFELCTNPMGFSNALPVYSANWWVSALSVSAAGDLRPSDCHKSIENKQISKENTAFSWAKLGANVTSDITFIAYKLGIFNMNKIFQKLFSCTYGWFWWSGSHIPYLSSSWSIRLQQCTLSNSQCFWQHTFNLIPWSPAKLVPSLPFSTVRLHLGYCIRCFSLQVSMLSIFIWKH